MEKYICVRSTDSHFMANLIDYISKQDVKKDSTIVRVADMDPFEELDLRLAQIDGMTERIRDLEHEIKKRNWKDNFRN